MIETVKTNTRTTAMKIELTSQQAKYLLDIAKQFQLESIEDLIKSLETGVLEIRYSNGTITWMLTRALEFTSGREKAGWKFQKRLFNDVLGR